MPCATPTSRSARSYARTRLRKRGGRDLREAEILSRVFPTDSSLCVSTKRSTATAWSCGVCPTCCSRSCASPCASAGTGTRRGAEFAPRRHRCFATTCTARRRCRRCSTRASATSSPTWTPRTEPTLWCGACSPSWSGTGGWGTCASAARSTSTMTWRRAWKRTSTWNASCPPRCRSSTCTPSTSCSSCSCSARPSCSPPASSGSARCRAASWRWRSTASPRWRAPSRTRTRGSSRATTSPAWDGACTSSRSSCTRRASRERTREARS